MSLLLDALKKAADDKIKNTGNTAPDETAADIKSGGNNSLQIDEKSSNEELSDSLELELDLETEQTDTQIENAENKTDSSLNDDFPEVDETVVTATVTSGKEARNKNSSKTKTDFIEETETTELDDSPLELTDSTTDKPEDVHKEETSSHSEKTILDNDYQKNAASELPDEKSSEISEAVTEETSASLPIDTSADKPTEKPSEKPEINRLQQQSSGKIKNEQALSALINKSNQYTRSEKLKKNITIIILITLILIGSGLYFYIEMQTTSQDLYIAQNNSEVNRQPFIEKTIPAVPSKPVKAPQQNIVKQTNTISKAQPVIKKPVVTKPRITQQTSTKQISIVRTKKLDPIHVLLRDAYTAFHNEDYRKSESLYLKVKVREANNRDALLGLAAIGIKEKRFEYARQKYQYLLKLNPRDSLAIAGMSSIESKVDPQLNESQLKFMLKQQPDSAHLYFALGSQYSSQNKWAEAQSAFFSAWSAENKNADYAYNLAVSLDHLDKKKQALDFYQLSLKLKQASDGNFSNASTEQRIKALKKAVQ